MANINFDTANTGYGGNYGGYPGYNKDYCKETCYPVVVPYNNNCNDDNNWTDLAALALVTGDGFGRRGRGDDCCDDKCCTKMIDMHDHHDDHNHEMDGIHGVQMEVCAAERQIGEGFADAARDTLETKYALDREILESKYDLGSQILESKFENALQGKDIIREIDLQSCGINRNIDSVKFNQEIIAKQAAMQLADCCCELKEKIRDSIDATNKAACEGRELAIRIDAKNDAKDAERERRALEKQIEQLLADKRSKEQADVLIANSGTITDSLNTAIANLGSTLTTA